MPFCSECGTKIADGVKFCPKCGTKQEVEAVAAAPAIKPVSPTPAIKETRGANHGPAYGLTAEANSRIAMKRDPSIEASVCKWIASKTGTSQGTQSFGDYLHTGVVLCKLANAISPGTIPKIAESSMAFKQMENISAFVVACRDRFGVPVMDLFMTVDLFEEKNLTQVLQCLATLQRMFQ